MTRPNPTANLFAKGIRYGGDYNPEQWPRPIWDEDVRLMGEAGVNLVSLGIFSWSSLEPSEGEFSFSWLRELLDLLGNAGIGVDLATPTAAPPPWLSSKYPEILPVDDHGARYSHGSRQHFCVSNPVYLRYARRIVEHLVAAVGDHRTIEMWHVHNEYAVHVPQCYCDHSAVAFREWVARHYGSLDAVNEAWGTSFWSQHYSDLAEIQPPRLTPTFQNPALVLDYRRFSNDAYMEEFHAEREILRAARPDIPVTTNFMGPLFKPLDYFKWAAEVDVVSTDIYQDPSDPEVAMMSAMHCDVTRSLQKAKPWLVMEQSSSRVNWRHHNTAKGPGQMRALSYQAISRGANGILFFQWRASRTGAEKFHSGMLSHSGQLSPSWKAVSELGQELSELGSFVDAVVESDAGVIFSWPNWWALEQPSKPANDLSVPEQVTWMYRPLYLRGVTTDFCRPDEPLGHYGAVVVPSLYLVTEHEAANIVSYVEQGGTAVISFWSGIVDAHDGVYLGPYGGPLRPIMGCDVVDVAPLAPGEVVDIEWAAGLKTKGTFWADIATVHDGQVMATFASGPWAGHPAVVQTHLGRGRSFYVGTRLDRAGLDLVYDAVPCLRGCSGTANDQPGVEGVVRCGSENLY